MNPSERIDQLIAGLTDADNELFPPPWTRL
jgi:hypothetical protein